MTSLRNAELLTYRSKQVKGVADAGSAAVRVSGMELGGLFGSLLAGRLSDFLVRKFPNDGAVGKRVQVGAGSCIGVPKFVCECRQARKCTCGAPIYRL